MGRQDSEGAGAAEGGRATEDARATDDARATEGARPTEGAVSLMWRTGPSRAQRVWKGAYGARTRSWNVPSRVRGPFCDIQAPYIGRERASRAPSAS